MSSCIFWVQKTQWCTIFGHHVFYKKILWFYGNALGFEVRYSENASVLFAQNWISFVVSYRLRHLYPRKFLIIFYNSFAKGTILYGVAKDSTAAKSNLIKINKHGKNFSEFFSFRKSIILEILFIMRMVFLHCSNQRLWKFFQKSAK